MYHSIREELHSDRHPYFETVTRPDTFRKQIGLLKRRGYQCVDFETAFDSSGRNLDRLVVITFDDGFQDCYTNAFPILQEFGFSATIFLPTAFIGKNSNGLDGRAHLTWNQVREMKLAGVAFGSHSIDHCKLEKIGFEELHRQLWESKAAIEDQIARVVNSFSHPFAFPEGNQDYTKRLHRELERAGYQHGVTTRIGLSSRTDAPLFRKRIPVNEHDDEKLLIAKVQGDYDWLYLCQSLFKIIKSKLAFNV